MVTLDQIPVSDVTGTPLEEGPGSVGLAEEASPGAERPQHAPPQKNSTTTVSVSELVQKPVRRRVSFAAEEHTQEGVPPREVRIIDFFGGSAAAAVAHVLAGNKVTVYDYWDLSPVARKHAKNVLTCLSRDFPLLFSREVLDNALHQMAHNPGDITCFDETWCRHQYTHVHGGWSCQDLSSANRYGKGSSV